MSDFEDRMREAMEFQQKQEDERRQEAEANKYRIQNFIDNMEPESLVILKDMLHLASHNPEIGHEFYGMITGCLVFKHHLTWDGEHTPLTAIGSPSKELTLKVEDSENEKAQNMLRFGLVPDGDYFKCTNCGQFYISLEDRMLRDPGPKGCKGCQEKAKFG